MKSAIVTKALCAALLATAVTPVTTLAAQNPAQAASTVIAIYAGTLLGTPGQPPVDKVTIIVQDGRVREIRAGFVREGQLPAGSKLIDLSNRFVLPGLMDMHTHVTMMLDQPRPTRLSEQFLLSPAANALRSAASLRRILQEGFTTLRDLEASPEVIFALRDAINNGEVEGPRLFAAGSMLSVTAGHGDNPHILEIYRAMSEESAQPCDGVDDCRKKTRGRILRGADVIKISTSASGSDDNGGPDGQPDMFQDELQAIVQTAAQHNVPVAAHVTATKAINFSIENGVRSIEHGTYADEHSFKLMKDKGTTLVPTTFVAEFLDKPQIRDGLKPDEWRALSAALKATRELPGKAYRAGVTLALGTDAGGEASAHRWRELALYVDSGVPAGEAIKAATVNAAKLLGRENSLGQVKAGYLADIIATCGDPLKDIASLSRVTFVMKDGAVVRNDGPAATCAR